MFLHPVHIISLFMNVVMSDSVYCFCNVLLGYIDIPSVSSGHFDTMAYNVLFMNVVMSDSI